MEARRGAISIVAVLAAAGVAWMVWPEGNEGKIRRELRALVAEANERAGDGLGTVAKAARLGSYFTSDIVVDFGPGTAPIEGRETLIGMATRLQPRTASLRVALEDVSVTMRPGDAIADVTLTATFTRRDVSTGEETIDAREFALEVRQDAGEWRIARVTTVDTLK
jgi:hypothetical protein